MALFDTADVKLTLAGHRARKLHFHQIDFLEACERKSVAFRDRCTVPVSHKQARPHRTARRAARSAIAQSQLEESSDLPSVSFGRVGLRKPAVVGRVRLSERTQSWDWEADLSESGDLCEELSDHCASHVTCKFGRPVAASDADTTASEQCPSDEAGADASSAEEVSTNNETVESEAEAADCQVLVVPGTCGATDAVLEVQNKKHEATQSQSQMREDVFRNVVAQLQAQRAASEEQAARLRKALSESATKSEVPRPPQMSLKQAKMMEQQRSKKTQKHVKQLRQHEQQKQGEMEAVRREAECQAKEITSRALEHADAIRAVAKENERQTQLLVAQESVVLLELQKSIDLKKCQLLDLDEREQQAMESIETERASATSRLQLVQSELADIIAAQAKIEAESRQAAAELESILEAKKTAEARLKQVELKHAADESRKAPQPVSQEPQPQDSKARAVPVQTLKNAKELDRQRTLKLNKQAAYQRTLKKHRDAEMCKIREEVERERAELLAAAENQLSAMKARVKTQAQALRQKRRRSSREGSPASRPQISVPLDQLEAPAIPEDQLIGGAPEHDCGASEQEPAIDQPAPSAETDADATAVVEKEQSEFQPDIAEDDWEVLSQESDADDTVWDLV